jgi:hypothetical protein
MANNKNLNGFSPGIHDDPLEECRLLLMAMYGNRFIMYVRWPKMERPNAW